MLDVGLAPLELGRLLGVHIEPQNGEAPLHESQGEWQTYVAQSDDAYDDGAVLNPGQQSLVISSVHSGSFQLECLGS